MTVAAPVPEIPGADESLLKELDEFLQRALSEHRAEWGDADSQAVRVAWQRRLAAERWVGLAWPKAFGGRGLGITDRLAVELQLGVAGAPPLAGFLGINNVGPTLIASGDAVHHRCLPQMLTAETPRFVPRLREEKRAVVKQGASEHWPRAY